MNTSTSHGSIAYKTPATSTNGVRKSFGPDGCQAVISGTKCGETKNLQIIKEFKRMYEDKMKQIDDIAGGDCIQAKVNLQQEWIKDLTDQNEMLVRVVEELEVEAAERVTLLEKKLQQSAKSAGEVMESYRDFSINFLGDLQKMEQVQNDMNSLLELIRRARAEGLWNTHGLRFYNFDINEIIGPAEQGSLVPKDKNVVQREDVAKEKDRRIKELEAQLRPYLESGKSPQDYDSIKKDYKELEQSMLDMRDALTAEVADKHDTVLCLRREVHLLEEQCRKADQQTHFKDDIIKELRKEIKQLRQQCSLQEAGDCLRVALPIDFMTGEVPAHLRTFCSKSLPLRIEFVDKEVQTANCSVGTPNWMGIVSDIVESTEHEKTLIVTLENECRNLVKQLDNKDKYIFDQNDLIVLLVQKLYVVYRTLRDLEEKTNIMAPAEKTSEKAVQLASQLKEALLDAKNQLAYTKERADAYAKERDHFKKELDLARDGLQKLKANQSSDVKELTDKLQGRLEEVQKIKEEKLQETEELKAMLNESFEENQKLQEEKDKEINQYKQKLKTCKEELESFKKDHLTANEDLNKQLTQRKDEIDSLKMKKYTYEHELQFKIHEFDAQVATLKKEKELACAQLAKVEVTHSTRINTVRSDMLKELENFEKQHSQTLIQLEQLRIELQKTKMEHRVCMNKIKDLGEENTQLKEQVSIEKPSKEVQSIMLANKAKGADMKRIAFAAVPTDNRVQQSEDSPPSSRSTDASVNTDTTWTTGVMTCEEPEYISVAVNTASIERRDFGFSAGIAQQQTSTTSSGIQCVTFSSKGSRIKDRQYPMDVFTCANSYIDQNKLLKEAEVEVSVTTYINDRDALEVLELLGPKKLEAVEPEKSGTKRLFKKTAEKKVELSTTPPKHEIKKIIAKDIPSHLITDVGGKTKAERDTSESSHSSPRTFDRKEALSTDAIDTDGSDVTVEGMPCSFPAEPGKSQECKHLKRLKSSPVKGKRNEVQATRDTPPQRFTAYPSDKLATVPAKEKKDASKEHKSVMKQPHYATAATNTAPRPCLRDVKCSSTYIRPLCNISCQAVVKQQDAAVAARPERRLVATKTQVIGVSASVKTAETGTSTEKRGSRIDMTVRTLRALEPKSVDTRSTLASSTDSDESYEDTILSQAKDKVLYVRCSCPTQELQTVMQDLNASASRIVQKSPDAEAKEKITRLEEQLRTALKQKDQAIEYERHRRNQEIENLKMTIQHMEAAIKNKQTNSENLQSAVDLYSDSITVLEESKQHYETEIAQQQITIANLQDALVITKRELEELRQKFKQDVSQGWAARWFGATDPKLQNGQPKNVHEV